MLKSVVSKIILLFFHHQHFIGFLRHKYILLKYSIRLDTVFHYEPVSYSLPRILILLFVACHILDDCKSSYGSVTVQYCYNVDDCKVSLHRCTTQVHSNINKIKMLTTGFNTQCCVRPKPKYGTATLFYYEDCFFFYYNI